MNTVATSDTVESLKNLHPAWRLASDALPPVLFHPYYEGSHSEPVQVVVERDGKILVSHMTWCYSFHKRGWLSADLFDGIDPASYAIYGRVLAWCPMQALR